MCIRDRAVGESIMVISGMARTAYTPPVKACSVSVEGASFSVVYQDPGHETYRATQSPFVNIKESIVEWISCSRATACSNANEHARNILQVIRKIFCSHTGYAYIRCRIFAKEIVYAGPNILA